MDLNATVETESELNATIETEVELTAETDFVNIDCFVKVTGSDATADVLYNKLVVGAGISRTVLNPGANEQLQLDISSVENLWDRTGTNLFPHTAGDSVDLGTGNLTAKYSTIKDGNQFKQLFPIRPSTSDTYFSSDIYGGQAIHLDEIANGGNTLQRFKIYGSYGVWPISGTVTATLGSDQIVGEGTAFESEMIVIAGDFRWIKINASYYQVKTVEDNTHLTLFVPSEEDWNGNAIRYNERTLMSVYLDGRVEDIERLILQELITPLISSTTNPTKIKVGQIINRVWTYYDVVDKDNRVLWNGNRWKGEIDNPGMYTDANGINLKQWKALLGTPDDSNFYNIIFPQYDNGFGPGNFYFTTNIAYNSANYAGGLLFLNQNSWEVFGGIDGITGNLTWEKNIKSVLNIDGATFSVGGVAGASGTFTTADSKTVTVTNGIITSIV